MTTVTASSNGVSKPKNGTATTKKTATNSAVSKTKTTSPTLQPVDLQAKVKNIRQLMELTGQLDRLNQTKEELSLFSFGSDKILDNLLITDSTGREFSTSNSNLISALNRHFQQLLDEKIDLISKRLVEAAI